MQETNIYGDVSGGWIFDQMDKFAHNYATQDIGPCVTASASIIYYSTLNPGKDYTMDYYFEIISPSKYAISVTMRTCETGIIGENIVATASFLFIKRK